MYIVGVGWCDIVGVAAVVCDGDDVVWRWCWWY